MGTIDYRKFEPLQKEVKQLREQLAEAQEALTAAYLRGRRNKASELQDELTEARNALLREGLARIEAEKQLAEGRKIVDELYSLNYTHGVNMKRADAWLKATKKRKPSVPPFVDC